MITISNETLQEVLTACRLHEVTLTSRLHALSLVFMTSRLPPEKASGFSSETPLDLRCFVDPDKTADIDHPDHVFAYLFMMMAHRHDPVIVATIRKQLGSDDSTSKLMDTVWSVAKRVQQETLAKLEAGMRNDILGMLKFVPDWKSYMAAELKKTPESSWVISSLGVIDGASEPESKSSSTVEHEEWILKQAVFGQSCLPLRTAMTINAISVTGKDLVITVAWQGNVVENAVVEGLAVDLKRFLKGSRR